MGYLPINASGHRYPLRPDNIIDKDSLAIYRFWISSNSEDKSAKGTAEIDAAVKSSFGSSRLPLKPR
jgi:hypothetical protein